ncbi:sporulation protein YqfC [Alkalibacillus aidingensis]|uniref:sporulation protein YqfC n=1 Tax=Alkalibacillus aidingensis TaxID=2747607 RepID=UPI001660A7B9|nr:sporulation protein YqfC [Alkalibacillus aidingensis]
MKYIPRKVNRLLDRYGMLPKDIIYDYPRITTVGNIHLYIENHRGLLNFEEHEIVVKQDQGTIVIKGNQMVIKSLLSEEIVIEGTIDQVLWQK